MHFKSGGKATSGLLLRNIFLVMKLIAFFLMIAILHMCTPALSQRVSISGKNLHLEQVFMEIRKQTGIEFVYESALLKAAHSVTLDVQNTPVEEVLQRCLQGQGLGFNVRSNTIIIFKPEDDSQATERDDRVVHITGRVVDAQGLPVEMASVVLGRTNAGTQTDRLGVFMLKVKNLLPNDSLIISFVGLKSSQINLEGKPDAGQIILQASDNALDEAMVIAYGTTSERFRTGDITTLKSTEIEKVPSPNMVEALAGRVPGLYIRQTGTAPSSVYNIQLRGYNIIPQDLTINPRDGVQILTRPLFVLDGLPMLPEVIDVFGANTGVDAITRITGAGGGQDPLYWLNAFDVESMSVLKDAEATALYGSRATNGVIMITTKKGKPGKTSVNVTFNTGVNVLARKLKLLNTQQYLAMRHEAWTNTMRAGLPVYGSTGSVSYTPNADNSYDLFVWDTTSYTDWQQVLLGSAPNYNAHLELSGGQSTSYRLSAGYNSVKAPYPTVPGKSPFKEERGTLTLKVASHSLNNRFKLVAAVDGSVSSSFQPGVNPEPYIFLVPNAPAMLDKAGNINNAAWRMTGSTNLATSNPLQVMTTTYHSNRFYMQVSTSLTYELFRSLVLTANTGYTRYDGRQLLRRPASSGDPNSPLFRHTSFFGNSLGTALALEPNIRYEVRLQRHHVIVQAGGSYQSDKQEGYKITASGYTSEQLMDNLAGAASYTTDANFVQRRAISAWGRITYRYAGKYLADLSGRRDGSSTFGPENRYGNFGSVGLGWIFTEETWCRNLPLLTFGKIRGSYGVTGNQNIRPYAYYSTYRPGGIYNGVPALNLTRAANPALGWVQAHSTDIGMDLYFLSDQRLKLTVQCYQKITGDQLITDTISSITGTSTYLHNLPVKVSNRGWEAMIDYRSPARPSRINWDIHFNIAANKNKLLAYPDLEYNNSLKDYYETGQPLYRQRLFPSYLDKTLGVYTFSAPVNQVTVYTAVDDNPAFTGGMQAGISWKGLSFSVACTYAKQKGFNNVQGSGQPGFMGVVSNQPVSVVQDRHWQSPADSTLGGAFYVVPITSQTLDIYWGDASYIAVKNASLNYQLPEASLRKIFINNLNFYIRAENLLFIPLSGYQGMNPEQPSLIYKQLPLRMTIVAGFTINI